MKENLFPEHVSGGIKVLNDEKILEFKKSTSSGYDEAEIVLENSSNETVISKIYINNYKHFKCSPIISIINKNSRKNFKVIIDDKNYKVSDNDIFLIISYPVNPGDNLEKLDESSLNGFFKNNSLKEKGKKLYLVGYKKEENQIKENSEGDELTDKIKELEKQVYEQKENENIEKDKVKKTYQEIKQKVNRKMSNVNYIYVGLIVLGVAFIAYKLFKKSK